MMGWALGRHAPERFASMVIGGAHPGPTDAAVWDRLDRVREHLGQGMPAYVAWRESQTGAWPPDFRDRVLDNDADALAAFINVAPDRRVDEPPADLSRMTMPVLVISGDDELYAGSQARQAAETLPSGTFIEIPDADHFTLYTHGDLILPHLTAFLARD
jgi:pimeloyl-ACP methyl ester carboxylesterase